MVMFNSYVTNYQRVHSRSHYRLSCIREINGEITKLQRPDRASGGSWKHKDFPVPVPRVINLQGPPGRWSDRTTVANNKWLNELWLMVDIT